MPTPHLLDYLLELHEKEIGSASGEVHRFVSAAKETLAKLGQVQLQFSGEGQLLTLGNHQVVLLTPAALAQRAASVSVPLLRPEYLPGRSGRLPDAGAVSLHKERQG